MASNGNTATAGACRADFITSRDAGKNDTCNVTIASIMNQRNAGIILPARGTVCWPCARLMAE